MLSLGFCHFCMLLLLRPGKCTIKVLLLLSLPWCLLLLLDYSLHLLVSLSVVSDSQQTQRGTLHDES